MSPLFLFKTVLLPGPEKNAAYFFLLCQFLFFTPSAIAYQHTGQPIKDNVVSSKKNNDSIPDQKDIRDVIRKLFGAKALPKDTIEIKPGKLLFAILPGAGYALATGLTAVTTANVSFYAGKSSNTNISSINTISEYSIFKHQLIIPVYSNIWTRGNKFNLLGDWRYYKYPTYTYGLGPNSELYNAQLIDYSYIRFYQQVSKHISNNFCVGAGYNLDYHYHIKELEKGDFQSYNDSAVKTTSSGLLINLLYDSRKNVNNPQGGFLGSIAYRPNFTFLGSDQNWQSLIMDFRKYFLLPTRIPGILAFWSYGWFTFGEKVPYLDLPSTGWDTQSSIGRGYIQGRLRSSNLMYLEGEYRFGITRNGLLGAVIFANAQTVSGIGNYKFETVLPGAGAGLRIKINKFSSANFDVDYGFGTGGSRGFFLNLCEVF